MRILQFANYETLHSVKLIIARHRFIWDVAYITFPINSVILRVCNTWFSYSYPLHLWLTKRIRIFSHLLSFSLHQ